MPAKRLKAVAQDAPATIEEATCLLATYRTVDDAMGQIERDAESAIAAIKTARDERIAPLKLKMKSLFGEARAWWGVAGEAVTEGKRKSVELAGVLIGERTTTPRLTHPGMTEEEAITALMLAGWEDKVVARYALDKPALLAFLKSDHAASITALGFQIAQREEFFLARVEQPQATETVEIAEAA